MDTAQLPVIDISSLRSNHDPVAMSKTAGYIRHACTEVGFFYIVGHGVSEDLQKRLEELSRFFFALPEAEKLKIEMNLGGKALRGYFPVGGELTSGKPDLKEGIYFGTELDDGHQAVLNQIPLHGKNLFPATPRELKEIVLEYMDELTEVGHAVMRGIALSLGLTSDHFQSTITADPFILFRIFHYPAAPIGKESWGVGEHTDYGLLTILKQDATGGLQVRSGTEWIDAPPIENAFVCNIGDMLDRMTGGLYVSTPHRVLNISGKNRVSFPLFFDPDFNMTIDPLPGFDNCMKADAQRWDGKNVYDFSGTYGDYIIQKVTKVFPDIFSQ